MENHDSRGTQQQLVGEVVTYVFVGTTLNSVGEIGGQFVSERPQGRIFLFLKPSDAVRSAVESVAGDPKSLYAGILTCEYQPEFEAAILARVEAISEIGEPGQVVVAMLTRELVRTSRLSDVEFHSLGNSQLSNGDTELTYLVDHGSLPLRQESPQGQEPARRRNVFIGRCRELDEVRRLLDVSRVVSVVGQSGLGKSALLSRFITEINNDFSDGIAKLDLSPISQPALVEPALVRLLEAPKLAGEDHLAALKLYLGPRKFLLVIDNAEHLLPEVRRIVAALIDCCPELAILVGSHRALRLPLESKYRLEGLEVPSIAEDWRVVQDYDAVALFVDRAQAVDNRFCVNAENASDICSLCRRLDGNPLAIEMAAVKTKALSAKQILGRLDDYRFELLKDKEASRPDRQKTLEATVHLGYSSLREDSRTLLRRLSVFLGAFTVDQAISVCSDADLSAENSLSAFEELVDSSMVNPSQLSGSEKRFVLLETIRAYGRKLLREHREVERFQARHRAWCMEFTVQANIGLSGRDRPIWLSHLDASYDDIRSVIDWHLTRRGDADAAMQMLLAINPYFFARQFLREGLRLASKIVQSPSAQHSPELARALNLASIFATRISDEESARSFAIRGVMEARRVGNLSVVARARNSLAFIAQDAGRLAKARRHFLGAIKVFRELREREFMLRSLTNVSSLETTMGLLDEAAKHLAEVEASLTTFEELTIKASFLQNSAHLSLARRMPLRALGYLIQGIEIGASTQDIEFLATCYRNCAYAYELLGFFSEAAHFIGAAKTHGRKVEQHIFDYEAENFRALNWRTMEALGKPEFDALIFEGSQIKVEDALATLTETCNAIFR